MHARLGNRVEDRVRGRVDRGGDVARLERPVRSLDRGRRGDLGTEPLDLLDGEWHERIGRQGATRMLFADDGLGRLVMTWRTETP